MSWCEPGSEVSEPPARDAPDARVPRAAVRTARPPGLSVPDGGSRMSGPSPATGAFAATEPFMTSFYVPSMRVV